MSLARHFRFPAALAALLILLGAAAPPAGAQGYQWKNFAGKQGGTGYVNGTGVNARFWAPDSVVVDGNGNVYVSDSSVNTIRKITSGGVVTTFAGGVYGFADGVGTTASFNYPRGLAIDGNGNIYVADNGNSTIRKITSAGVVTTLAGFPRQIGSTDGTGSAARFNNPMGVAVDASGTVYVADQGNSTIRKVTSAGVVTTLAGKVGVPGNVDGTGSAARFFAPFDVAVDAGGNVYVADPQNGTIRKVTSAGVVTTLPGFTGEPRGLATDAVGNLYVGNYFPAAGIVKITSTGQVSTLAGGGTYGSDDGTGSAAQFSDPDGLAVDANGNVYVSDSQNAIIRKITSDGVVTTLAGSAFGRGSADGLGSAARFYYPFGVAVDGNGFVYVADTYNHTIRKATAAGQVTTLAGIVGNSYGGDGIGTSAGFNTPWDLVVDSGGNIFVADTYNDAIRKITSDLVVTTFAGVLRTPGSADGTGSAARFGGIPGITMDSGGNLYVADGSNRIRKITNAGVVTTIAGLTDTAGSANGTGSAARFNNPVGVVVDGSGNLFVTDNGNNTIRKITSAGVVTTFAGTAGLTGSVNGPGSLARFNGPSGITLDGSGNLYVADSGNNTIRKINSSGLVTTIGGTAGIRGGADGAGSAAQFDSPEGIAVSSTGVLYVADMGNNRIFSGTFDSVTTVPILTTPATNTAVGNPINVAYTLPEAATNGTVKLTFTGSVTRVLTLANPLSLAGTYAFPFNPANPTAAAEIASGTAIPDGPYTVTLSYQDALGNSAAAATSSNVRIDTVAPVLTLPDSLTTEATGPAGAIVNYTASASDAGGSGVATSIFLPASGSTFPVGMTTVNASVTDSAGNTTTGYFTVTVTDTTSPVLTIPTSPVVVEATGPGGAAVVFTVSANDLVDGAVAATPNHASGSLFPIGDTLVHVTAMDAHRNPSSADFTVRVVDNTGPVLNLPVLPVTVTTSTDSAVVTFDVSATDLVDGALSATATPASGSLFQLGDTLIHVTAQDSMGNTTSGSFVVRVTAASGLVGNYVALLAGPNGYAAVNVRVSAGRKVSGYLRRPDGRRVTLPGTILPASNVVTLNVSDGSMLTLSFDGLGHMMVTGSFTGSGDLATSTPPPTLPGHYAAMLQARDGSLGWLTLAVSSRGVVRVVGRLPDGTAVSAGAGTNVERGKSLAILGISSAGGHPQIAGKVVFADLALSDVAGPMKWRNGAGISQGCEFNGAKVGPGSAGSLPLVIDQAGVNITGALTLGATSGFGTPLTGLRYASSTGNFFMGFRAGSITHATGVYQQKAGVGVGNFIKGGQTGRIVIGTLPPVPAFRSIAGDGSGTPPGTVGQTISADRRSFTLIFDQYIVSAGSAVPVGRNAQDSQFTIPLDGAGPAVFSVTCHGYLNLPAGVTATITGTLVSDPAQTFSQTFTGPLVQDYLFESAFNVTVGGGASVDTSIALGNTGVDAAQATVDSIDGSLLPAP